MTSKTFHCANKGLYLGATLLILLICTYAAIQAQAPGQLVLAASAALICLVWGGYYATLSYSITPAGVSRRVFFCRRTLLAWDHIEHIEEHTIHTQETTSLTLTFHGQKGSSLALSSDLLPLEEMEQLAEELRTAGLLSKQGQE